MLGCTPMCTTRSNWIITCSIYEYNQQKNQEIQKEGQITNYDYICAKHYVSHEMFTFNIVLLSTALLLDGTMSFTLTKGAVRAVSVDIVVCIKQQQNDLLAGTDCLLILVVKETLDYPNVNS